MAGVAVAIQGVRRKVRGTNSPETPSFFCQLAWGFKISRWCHGKDRGLPGLNRQSLNITDLRRNAGLGSEWLTPPQPHSNDSQEKEGARGIPSPAFLSKAEGRSVLRPCDGYPPSGNVGVASQPAEGHFAECCNHPPGPSWRPASRQLRRRRGPSSSHAVCITAVPARSIPAAPSASTLPRQWLNAIPAALSTPIRARARVPKALNLRRIKAAAHV